jgi:hypothetical protein
MAYDVFISFTSEDKSIAYAIHSFFKDKGLNCYLPSRDKISDQNASKMIFEAIDDSKMFVIILSSNSNKSPQIITELNHAINNRQIVIPFKIVDTEQAKNQTDYLGITQFVDAIIPILDVMNFPSPSECERILTEKITQEKKIASYENSYIPSLSSANNFKPYLSISWKTVRVFISSTFRDMQAERDHLVRFVFPRLREELLFHRIHFVDVDLRWGVTGNQDALSVCREVIDDCRPRFICILGGRYGWVPPGRKYSITADEVYYGVLDRLGHQGYAFFYFREPTVTNAMIEKIPGEFRELSGSTNEKQLAELKQAIEKAGLNPFVYPARWNNETKRLIGLNEFGERIYSDLMQSIVHEFGNLPTGFLNEYEEENASIETFIEVRAQRFIVGSRQQIWDDLISFIQSPNGNKYLCLVGQPGSGKSSLLARFAGYLSHHESCDSIVIPHFVGASIHSSDVVNTIRRLCYELISNAGIPAKIPEDPKKIAEDFSKILANACLKKRVILILDAVNQFNDSLLLSGLTWLPDVLPDNARIILSTIPGPVLDDLRRRHNPPREAVLEPLTRADSEDIIASYLHRYRKTMTDEQHQKLLAKTDSITPLYLITALEELRTLGTFEEITDRITQLPPRTQDLFIWILTRLEDDDGFRDSSDKKIGRLLVPLFASLMGVSRHGLSQQELMEIISHDNAEPKYPVADDVHRNVAALIQLLIPYLMRRGFLLDFYHEQFRKAVETKYFDTKEKQIATHRRLADYFVSQAYSVRDGTWKGKIPRGFSELLFHLKSAGMWTDIVSCLQSDEIFAHLWPGSYGLDFDRGIYFVPDPDALNPASLFDLPAKKRSELGYAIASAFSKHARSRMKLTYCFKRPWPETAQKLRESEPERFVIFRDAFYSFTRLAGKSAEFALASFDDSQEGLNDLKVFFDGNADIRSFLNYLESFGSDETGLSHALEDDAFPSFEAWEKIRNLVSHSKFN